MKKGISSLAIFACTILCFLSSCHAFADDVAPSVGDTITFGHYEQDNNQQNGPESIEWLILSIDKESGTALAVSKYLIDCQIYNSSTNETSWNNCTIRNWLNSSFWDTAFNSVEKESIVSTNIGNSSDSVFLLNSDQINKLLSSELCYATPYAKARGVYVANDTGTSSWWVRKNTTSTNGVFVGAHGKIYEKGNKVTITDNGIRPAISLSLSYKEKLEQSLAFEDVLLHDETRIDGYGIINITKVQVIDKLGRFEEGVYGTSDQDFALYYDSNSNAQFLIAKVDIDNVSNEAKDYLQDASILVQCGNNYKLKGWGYQYNYANGQSTAYYINEEDSGEQNKNYVIHPSDNFQIAPGEIGHFCFGCTVPNDAFEQSMPIEMIITINDVRVVIPVRE